MKALHNIERIQFNNETIIQLLSLYECKGKEFYYKELFSKDISNFKKKTLEYDVIAIASILNLKISDARIRQWAKKDLIPKNKDEEMLRNVKKALVQIMNLSGDFELITNEVLDLGKMLNKDIGSVSFDTYDVDGEGLIKKKKSKREDLEELIREYDVLRHGKKHELIQLITNLYIDFLNMKVLTSSNSVVGLILLYSLLAKNFKIYNYASFFKYFDEKKDVIGQAIIQAEYYWTEGYAQTETLFRIIVEILTKSYNEIEEIAKIYEFERTLNKSDSIENTVLKLSPIFTKEDIRRHHPNISDKTIDRTLSRLRDENKIKPLGKGRSSKWQRTKDESSSKNAKQLSFLD